MKGNSHVTYSLINTRVETENEADANARLIAAAPELLEALTLALATIERLEVKHGSFSSVAGTLDVCRKAIDKAEGKA